ncbi:serologically defined colon cancer antigen 8 homolog isoform X2 [Macrosteles quadrilineatus]|uniref:serologically defined colon cancer antigen 8 homolog isoform X2 n=1 Tax=Macrosteles quadrilineatus TaxID=74068 RepID=UPI0023E1DCB0|nr:serologically defined colon cancer antigen 8 homolog isoform X2 [Macrosteles quadrilineatus]
MEGLHKKGAGYTDFAYREAVSKLRYLLAESYTPSTGFSKYSLGHYHPFLPGDGSIIPSTPRPAIVLKKPDADSQPTPELMSFVQRQEEYIEQLEKESQYCREELSNLMGKVKEVITENEGLHEKRKAGMLQYFLDSFEDDDDDDDDASSEDKVESRSRKKPLVGPSIIFESRISELEAQLTQTKMDLKKAVEEAETLRKKMSEQGLSLMSYLPQAQASESELYKQIEALQREREELNDMINKLHGTVAQLREKEANTSQKLKRSLDAVDQAQFEKNQCEMEMRRLKNELERMNEKQRESLGEHNRRLAEVERRYTNQTEQLSADLSAQWENSTKLSLDLEKQRRTESELRRELVQRNATIDELKKELNTKTSALQSELLASSADRDSLAQEAASLRLAVERAERTSRQETARLQAEVTSLRQRLDRADADLLHARKENLRLTEQIASLEKELHLTKLTHDGGENEILKDSKREKELTSMILDMDAKHVQNIAELEGMIQSQAQLVDKLKDECHSLTEKLEDTSMRHKETRNSLREENEKLLGRLASVWESCKELHLLCTQYGLAVPSLGYEPELQMTEWWGNMNSRSMPNSPRRVDDFPLSLQDLSLPKLYL